MLSDRIQKTSTGFSVIREGNTDQDTKAYFGTYTLKEAPDCIPELKEVSYWKPMADCEIIIGGPGCFVYVVEKQGEEIVEDTRFYWSGAAVKPSLLISTNPADRKYGEQAFEIKIKWSGSGEPINNEYIFLKSIRNEKYNFLRKMIGGNGKTEESYIYIVPEGDDPENYSVAVLPQLKDKYNVVME